MCWLPTLYQIAAAVHDHIPHDLFGVAQLLNKIAQQRVKVDLQVDQVFLQQDCYDFD